jgi:hypothetical protein
MSSQHSQTDPHIATHAGVMSVITLNRAACSLDDALRDARWASCLTGSSTTVAAAGKTLAAPGPAILPMPAATVDTRLVAILFGGDVMDALIDHRLLRSPPPRSAANHSSRRLSRSLNHPLDVSHHTP